MADMAHLEPIVLRINSKVPGANVTVGQLRQVMTQHVDDVTRKLRKRQAALAARRTNISPEEAHRRLNKEVASYSEDPVFKGYDASKCNALAGVATIVHDTVEFAGTIGRGLDVRRSIDRLCDNIISSHAVHSCMRAGGGVIFACTVEEAQTEFRETSFRGTRFAYAPNVQKKLTECIMTDIHWLLSQFTSGHYYLKTWYLLMTLGLYMSRKSLYEWYYQMPLLATMTIDMAPEWWLKKAYKAVVKWLKSCPAPYQGSSYSTGSEVIPHYYQK